jgi:plasmid stabilization system protein ParE
MVKWTPKAEEDLRRIRDHIVENFDWDMGVNCVEELIDRVEALLSANPMAGAILTSNPLFSKLVVDGNVVFYCENPHTRDIYVVYVRPRNTKFDPGRF